ncbi:hypothetical protein [Herbidospora yilanensis]|uniref:hypothetical protein n=1 Tax=Herbidospora yilanensis TaxID=354426 RepID=UPI0012F80C6C|nr:hypothetical protein [Herbidospora yilanensis]
MDYDARRADLPGHVIRIVHLQELHVFDPERLIAAAREAGWRPIPTRPGRTKKEDPTEDLQGAASYLAYLRPPIPGTEPLAQQQSAWLLREADEVIDWSEHPITAEFANGRLLQGDNSGRPTPQRSERSDT